MKLIHEKVLCAAMLIASQFTLANRYLSTEDLVKKTWHIYSVEYIQSLKERNLECVETKLIKSETICLQKQANLKKTNVMFSLICDNQHKELKKKKDM